MLAQQVPAVLFDKRHDNRQRPQHPRRVAVDQVQQHQHPPWGSTWIAGARHEGCIQSQRRMQTYRQPSCQKIARKAPLKALGKTRKEKRASPLEANPLF